MTDCITSLPSAFSTATEMVSRWTSRPIYLMLSIGCSFRQVELLLQHSNHNLLRKGRPFIMRGQPRQLIDTNEVTRKAGWGSSAHQPAAARGPILRFHPRLLHVVCGPMHADFHLHPRAETVQHRYQAVHREAPKVSVADAGEVGRCDARAGVRRAHGQSLPAECLDDLSGQDGLELLRVGTLVPKVTERIAAPPHHFQLLTLHRNISFSRFKRSLINSISCCGVLIPCVDFFWNACTTQISSPSCTA